MKKHYTHTQVISTEAGLAVVQHDYEDSAPMGMADRIHNYVAQMRGGVFTPRQQRRLVKKLKKEEGPVKYRKKPVVIEAVRYGKDRDGSWYPGAVQRVAAFMLGREIDAELTDGQCLEVVRPVGAWDPPENAELEMWDGTAHGKWLPLALGDHVIRGVKGEFYPCKPDILQLSYEVAE